MGAGTWSSESLDRGAGCGSSARPDLWEPRVGNRPRPPGRHLWLGVRIEWLSGHHGLQYTGKINSIQTQGPPRSHSQAPDLSLWRVISTI